VWRCLPCVDLCVCNLYIHIYVHFCMAATKHNRCALYIYIYIINIKGPQHKSHHPLFCRSLTAMSKSFTARAGADPGQPKNASTPTTPRSRHICRSYSHQASCDAGLHTLVPGEPAGADVHACQHGTCPGIGALETVYSGLAGLPVHCQLGFFRYTAAEDRFRRGRNTIGVILCEV
jgi:hypothetical protein